MKYVGIKQLKTQRVPTVLIDMTATLEEAILRLLHREKEGLTVCICLCYALLSASDQRRRRSKAIAAAVVAVAVNPTEKNNPPASVSHKKTMTSCKSTHLRLLYP